LVVNRRGRRGRAGGGAAVSARGDDDGDDAANDDLGTGKDVTACDEDDSAGDDSPGSEPARDNARKGMILHTKSQD